jgi:flavin-dependent dehydrogenase
LARACGIVRADATMEPMRCDVLVLGGGPAGAVTAALLARDGVDVTVLERARFPRFHLGESLSPAAASVLDELGLRDSVDGRYLRKHGVALRCARTGRQQRFRYDEAFEPGPALAWQVPRADFDDLLLRCARLHGAEVVEGCAAEDVLFDDGVASGVIARREDGRQVTVRARLVVDATGQHALLAGRRGDRHPVDGMERTALSAHFRNVARAGGEAEGDLELILFPHGWIWNIPFLGEVSSVGALCANSWMRARQPAEALEAFFDRTVDDASFARDALASSTRLTPVLAHAGLAWRANRRVGDGWITVGDAGGFADPLLCAGTTLAIGGAARAAAAVRRALDRGDLSARSFGEYARALDAASELFLGTARSLYAEDLSEVLLGGSARADRRAFASILAGDVFGEDPPWRAAWRERFPADG